MRRPLRTEVWESLPGVEIVEQGIEDLTAGLDTLPALLVSVGWYRLRRCGLGLPVALPDAEHRLYGRLATEWGDGAHSRYNALIRRLVSFERALECAA